MNPIKRAMLRLAGCIICLPLMAYAGYDESYAAFRTKDYPKALTEARKAADQGEPRAYYLLGMMYQGGYGVEASAKEAVAWYEKAAHRGVSGASTRLAQLYARGEGVQKDTGKALEYARRSAMLGDSEGMLYVYITLKNNTLSYLGANRKANPAKYQQLASRPVSERALDAEALDALYRASEKGNLLATDFLVLNLSETLGKDNRKRIIELAELSQKQKHPSLKGLEKVNQNYTAVARYMDGLGQSLASPKVFMDAQASQLVAAMAKTCGLKNKDGVKKSPPVLTATSISKPLSGEVYLPSSVSGYENAYLVAGEWEEDWTYKGCGKTETITVRFTADGLGGARFSSTVTSSGKANNKLSVNM